ncbi:hypothetical protein LPB72_12285 [Hydrogenophaga crassostreae]|uniref:Uncharacterized protein n=1 Tax=Hydrogenophaga crassostreae TaxID=1763535 RepID=A0A167I269_9BURK|nr:hypothetical protein [Hydrogenophaga crassostreae]AOW13735.1 hypothetical protein LPB072_13665 [Hydrogenophaga crassostreae]OAD42032.1 hypothetical protein LPB72_12285 [Hydrogenophaga crassostreae]
MSALDGKGFNLATIPAAIKGAEMHKVDRLRETPQRKGVAIPFDQGPVEGRSPCVTTGQAPGGASRRAIWALMLWVDQAERTFNGHSATTAAGCGHC